MTGNKNKWFVENRSGDLYAGPGEWVAPSKIDDAEPFETEEEARKVVARFTPLMTRPVYL